MINTSTNYFKNSFCILLFLTLINSSCKKNNDWVNYNEIEIVRSSRDSTFYFRGKLFDGEIKKFDKQGNIMLNFNVKDGRLNGRYFEIHNNGNLKINTNYDEGKLNGEFISYFQNKNVKEQTYYRIKL